jgi:glycosyltransferase involved in cell wall biosynthesis
MCVVIEKPLASLLLVTYKQEKFVREAVRSALEQTYEPLEIILSDDCSPDNTFAIMIEEANNYKGPHTLILNRNDKNLGLVRHLERAVEISHGEFIIVQAGDDISETNRVEILTAAWKNPHPVDIVCSDVLVIDNESKIVRNEWNAPLANPLTIEDAVNSGVSYVLGCSAGYSRCLFTEFPPIHDFVYQEDNVLSFRALLKNGIRLIPEKLISYRIHENNIYHNKLIKKNNLRLHRNLWGIASANLAGWDRTINKNNNLRRALLRRERLYFYRMVCLEGGTGRVILSAIKCVFDGLTVRNAIGLIKYYYLAKSGKL